ncbi:MAG: glycosyltransferase family 2 protein [Ignavibacteriales bacterium]|nr:glycosyltransferase family 2 protein [Ignavibacteriales bacterium]
MKVSGFSFIRNAVLCDYPIVEAIRSILPLCDEVVVAVGKSEDETLNLVRSIHPSKVRVLETVWDDNIREGGQVFAMETDKAFQAIAEDADWAVCIQGDEIVHENSLDKISQTMAQWKDEKDVEGLLVDFTHFYGSYNYVADSYDWHRREVRIVRNDKSIFSYGDSMGFRKRPNEKLRVKQSEGMVYHYSYVKPPDKMMAKARAMHKLWHDDRWIQQELGNAAVYEYGNIGSLKVFTGTHPQVMEERMKRQNWTFNFDVTKSRMRLKYRVRKFIETTFGVNVGEYRNYKLIE